MKLREPVVDLGFEFILARPIEFAFSFQDFRARQPASIEEAFGRGECVVGGGDRFWAAKTVSGGA